MDNDSSEFKGYTTAIIENLDRRFSDFQGQIDRRFDTVDKTLDEIKNNHIAHLQARLEEVDKILSANRWWIIGLLGSVIATLAVEIMRRM